MFNRLLLPTAYPADLTTQSWRLMEGEIGFWAVCVPFSCFFVASTGHGPDITNASDAGLFVLTRAFGWNLPS